MAFFKKSTKVAGHMAIQLQADGISLAHVRRSQAGHPVVDHVSFHPAQSEGQGQVLAKLVKELDLSRYQCSHLLNAGEYQIVSVDAPNVPAEELKTAIRWKLKDLLDFHVDDATVDVLDVPVPKDAPNRSHSMFAVAARNQLIEKRQAMFENAKAPLHVIDIAETAQRNIAALLEQPGRGLAVLSFDENGGLLTISFEGELYLARRIDIPLDQLGSEDIERRNAVFDRLVLELQRSFDHFDRQYRHITLSRLVLAPFGEGAMRLEEYLTPNLYVPVKTFDLADVLDIAAVPDLRRAESQRRHLLTIGAALRNEEVAL